MAIERSLAGTTSSTAVSAERRSGGLRAAKNRHLLPLVLAVSSMAATGVAIGHGFAGKRFFPATLTTDDPFVADELSLPTISSIKTPAGDDGPATRETGFSVDVSKRITDNLGIGFGASYNELRPDGGVTQRGFDNIEANIKYQFYENDDQETILSVGADWDIGGTGSKRVGAESFSTVTPAIFFGKGFGDLPESAMYLRPFALTGSVGIGIPTRSSTTSISADGDINVEQHPHTLEWGFAIEYSLPYLQAFVKDVGLSHPFSQMIPVVEFALSTPLDRGRGPTTGTVNPGILWAGRTMQLGLEAMVPINRQTGSKVGWIAQLHFFLDDLFPTSIGRPLLGSGR
jgi:hypothetical protein